MTVLIENAAQWASSNNYSLRSLSSTHFAVSSEGAGVGVLQKVAGGYEYTSLSNTASPSNHVEEDAEFISNSFGLPSLKPMELNKLSSDTNDIELSAQVSGTGSSERVSDCNYWLPFAAEHYNISRDIRDYILIPLPAIFSDFPNTNGDSLALSEMVAFLPQHGMQMYKTFKGKPTHTDHQNKILRNAKGVILESYLRPVPFNQKYWKNTHLLAFDRSKDPQLCNQILSGERNCYSVGFTYSSYTCAICGTRVGTGINLIPCSHTKLYEKPYKQADGRLVYRKCENAVGFENSSVATPAFVSAIGPKILSP